MTTLFIKEYIDKFNDYSKAGNAFFSDASPMIEQGLTIGFDMKGLDAVSTVFLNASFGQLIDRYGIKRVKESFKFSNLLRSQADRIRKYFIDYDIINEKVAPNS